MVCDVPNVGFECFVYYGVYFHLRSTEDTQYTAYYNYNKPSHADRVAKSC